MIQPMFQRTARLGFQILLTLSCTTGLVAAQSTIQVCGAELRLGTPKDQVLQVVGAHCDLKRLTGIPTDDWCATENGDCHVLEFRRDVLVFVSKETAFASGDAAENVANRIYSFIREQESSGQRVTVSINREVATDTLRIRTVLLTAGDRSMSLDLTQAVGSAKPTVRTGVQVVESLKAAQASGAK